MERFAKRQPRGIYVFSGGATLHQNEPGGNNSDNNNNNDNTNNTNNNKRPRTRKEGDSEIKPELHAPRHGSEFGPTYEGGEGGGGDDVLASAKVSGYIHTTTHTPKKERGETTNNLARGGAEILLKGRG